MNKKTSRTREATMYQDMVSFIADVNLSKEQYRVFLKLLGKVDFDNYLTISQTKLAQELNMKQPHISRAIKALCERKVIVEGPCAGLNKTYRFNPYIAHKGSNVSDTIIDFETITKEKTK